MTDDECRIVDVDGEPVLVRGSREWTAGDTEAFATIIRAARQKMAAQQAEEDDLRPHLRARKILTPAEAAILIRKGRATIYRWIRAGLGTTTIAGQKYVDRKELLRWAADEDRRTRRSNRGTE